MKKIDLITGFLGAGKTTFLLSYARYLIRQGEKIGILEYDYGALNTDLMLLSPLRGECCELESVAAGCDEDCLRRRFRTKLISMAMSDYDRIIVEPSGVFDMDLFFDTLREDPLENWYEIGNVITVVDAMIPSELTREERFFLASQVSCAGRVLMSRTQLCDEERIRATKEMIESAAGEIRCRGFHPIYETKVWDSFTENDFEKLRHSGYQYPGYIKSIAGSISDFASLCFLNCEVSMETLKLSVSAIFKDETCGEILRMKGFIQEGESFMQINATKHALVTEEVSCGQKAMMVIGRHLNESRIRQHLGMAE